MLNSGDLISIDPASLINRGEHSEIRPLAYTSKAFSYNINNANFIWRYSKYELCNSFPFNLNLEKILVNYIRH
jgi:hypothetical protein